MDGMFVPPPAPYVSTPSTESRAGSPGSDAMLFSMGNHQHPRLASATYVTSSADGTAQVDFTRTFPVKPSYALFPEGDFGQAVPTANVISWIMGSGPTAGQYVGAIIRAIKPANSAPLAAVTVLSVSVAVGAQIVTPVFANAPGVAFSCIFLQNSTV